jgi:predicted nucleotidyltransferase
MRFHSYAEGLFSSQVSISLIRSLFRFRGRIFTLRSLASVSGVSPAETALVAKRLEQLKVIQLQPVGRSYQVSLNEKSYVLNKIMKKIIVAEEKTFGELLSIVKRNLTDRRIISACIFGSVFRREEREDSDVDILVISDDFDAAAGMIARAYDEVFLTFGNRLSPIIMSEREFRKKARDKDSFVMSVLEGHTTFKGKDIRELIRE